MKKIFYITLLCLLLLPLLVSAADPPKTPKIEFKLSPNMPDMPTPCEYIRFLYLWGLGIVGALAVVVIAIGGFLRIVGKAEQGTGLINSALIGLLMVLASWLILNTINPDLAKLKCDLTSLPPAPTATTPPGLPPGTPAPDQAVYDQITQATNGQVTVNGRCTDSTKCIQGRTCLNGMQSSTINGVIDMQKACNCSFVLTGGTEACHATTGTFNHPNGYKADLRFGSTISSYIYGQIGTYSPKLDTNYKGADGNTYRIEKDHWDVCFKCP